MTKKGYSGEMTYGHCTKITLEFFIIISAFGKLFLSNLFGFALYSFVDITTNY